MSKDQKYTTSGELTDDCQFIKLDHYSALRRVTQRLLGQKLEVSFTVLRFKRSDAQNRYIWGVIVPCVQAWHLETFGEAKTKDEIYTWLRIGLLGHTPVLTEVMGVQVISMTGKRFSKMNTKEFAEATDLILKKMAEKHCIIPEPRQNNFLSDIVEADMEYRKSQE